MKQVKGSLVPKLRFREFAGDGDWKKQPLGKFLDYQQPTPYLVSDTKYSDDYKIPVLTAGKTFVLGYTNEQHGIFKDNLPVIIFDDFTTATQFVDFPFKAKSSAMKILLPKNGVSIKFMHEAMKMISYEVGSHERHWISKFAPMLIAIPTDHREQQKIADCLSSLDELIDAEDKKLEALERHKKGLMQELFPAEGQTLPKLRFPEFADDGEWNKELGSGLFWSINNKKHNSDLSILAITQEHGAIPRDKIDYRVSVTEKSIESYKVVEVGDFIISLRSFQGGIEYSKYKGLCSPAYIILRRKRDDHEGFFKHYFKTNRFIEDLNRDIEGIRDGKMVSYDQFSKIIVPLPKSKLEQQKIADCFSSVDDIITSQTQKIDALKKHKKGLMQQLFPNAHEAQNLNINTNNQNP